MPDVEEFLDRWDFRRLELDGRTMTSRIDAHAALHSIFDFPDWCGSNWDAFNDCFGNFVHANDGARIAVLWRHLDTAAQAAPATTAEVAWALLSCQVGDMPSLGPNVRSAVDLHVFVIGEGPDFDGPE
jgi:RNAse (barnase) inhibitor barstar